MTALELHPPLSRGWVRALAVVGPGLVVMLADTDSGSLITAAQSGAQWGYKLLPLQLILIPILFIVQELAVRLGLVTRKGHGELIREHFGRVWAWVSVSTLALSCVGALITQLSGIAGVAQLFGVPESAAVLLTVTLIIALVVTGSYRSVERVALAFGLFELVFLGVAWEAGPSLTTLATEMQHPPLADPGFLYLIAANIGAVIMPWMIFYHQSAVVDKGMGVGDMKFLRLDTAVGSVVTQVVMCAMLVAVAATIGKGGGASAALDSVPQIAQAITPALGDTMGRIVFALGISGAALVATLVVCLTAAWGLGEVMGFKHSLECKCGEAPWFYGIFSVSLVAGGVLVCSGVNLVNLSVGVEVMNALLLPIVLGFLFLLARRALPEPYRLKGTYAVMVGTIIVITVGFGLYSSAAGIFFGAA